MELFNRCPREFTGTDFAFEEKSFFQSRGREQRIDEQKINIKTHFPSLMFLVHVIEIFAANYSAKRVNELSLYLRGITEF